MNTEQKERVLKAIKAQRSKGVELVSYVWGVLFEGPDDGFEEWCTRTNKACALGCLLLEEQPDGYRDQDRAAAMLLDAPSTKAIDAFIDGFDGLPLAPSCEGYASWFEAGREVALEAFADEPIPYKLTEAAA